MQTSSIDDVLANDTASRLAVKNGGALQALEKAASVDVPPITPVDTIDKPQSQDIETEYQASDIKESPKENDKPIEAKQEKPVESNVDDYGNEKPTAKTYSEDEVNERINRAVRERLERAERNKAAQQPAPQQQTQTQPAEGEEWEGQLKSFIKNTLDEQKHMEAQRAYEAREQALAQEFDHKFRTGMERFGDFQDVVGKHPISDPMLLATRGLQDPASFWYAAAKKAPEELARIANIPDYYAQMREIGKLEERMRSAKPTTKAPRPIDRTSEDSNVETREPRAPTIEEMCQTFGQKKLAAQNAFKRK